MKLFIVATPIGNLQDITLRALDTLRSVDFIACEDTRSTGFLLQKFEIKKEMISLNAQNESSKVEHILRRIQNGDSCALTSDAGTPLISDPGTRLVAAAIKNNIAIESIPGATACITALTLSGFPSDSFLFEGFLPQKKGRQKKLKALSEFESTIVFYESPHRIEKLLTEMNEYFHNRQIAVCRELTKKFEEVWRGTAKETLDSLSKKNIKGEFTIVVAPTNWKIL